MTGEDGTSDRDGHGMGDERSGRGRRGPAHGDRTTPGPTPSYDQELPYDDSTLGALLGAAIRGEKTEGEAERRAVDAFRAARDAGAHRARTRRRDDWRPRARRRTVRSLRTTLSVLLASLTLGGVAYAAIGSVGGGPARGAAGDGSDRPSVTASTPAESPGAPTPSASADRPPTAKDTLARCRVYEQLRGRGKALDSTAFQRLATAAGGEANVSAYCAALTGGGTADAKPGKQKANANAGKNTDKNSSRKH
ncbi:hypothetical protein AB0D34_44580 [Streptomyces sp. NPDC048420]|uniref:hypothetical protein n=1 Tax=Streptomyces sp. NPDC048420 TaxID=3155755 RepID=UPI00342C40E5